MPNDETTAQATARALAAELRGEADDGRELTVVEMVQACERQGISVVDKLAEALDRAEARRQ